MSFTFSLSHATSALLMEPPAWQRHVRRKKPVIGSQRRPDGCLREWRHTDVYLQQLYYTHLEHGKPGEPSHTQPHSLIQLGQQLVAAWPGPPRTHVDPIITGRIGGQSLCFPALRRLSGTVHLIRTKDPPAIFGDIHTILTSESTKMRKKPRGDFHAVSRVAVSELKTQLSQSKRLSPTHGPVFTKLLIVCQE